MASYGHCFVALYPLLAPSLLSAVKKSFFSGAQRSFPAAAVTSHDHVSVIMGSACLFLAKKSHGPIGSLQTLCTVSPLMLVINLFNSLSISWELILRQTWAASGGTELGLLLDWTGRQTYEQRL